MQFVDSPLGAIESVAQENAHFIIDERIASLYENTISLIAGSPSMLRIEATESAKSLDQFPLYVTHLVEAGLRRDHTLIAVGGGIIQDITCFLAATMLRGVEWSFVPTTLLAQADSCIGSKSSINGGGAKNILGTFTPPHEIALTTTFLKTLKSVDLKSGMGEILKVHAIAGGSLPLTPSPAHLSKLGTLRLQHRRLL